MHSPPVSVLLLESQDAVQQWLNVKQELARYVVCVCILYAHVDVIFFTRFATSLSPLIHMPFHNVYSNKGIYM